LLIKGDLRKLGFAFDSQEFLVDLTLISSFYFLYLDWRFEAYIYTTTFEKLVGQRGGGDNEVQLQEIINIANHIGQKIDENEAMLIVSKLYGGTATFNEGKIGSWKKYFLPRHKVAFKNIPGANEILVELGYEKDFDW